jgi:hypothetical protein
MEEAWQSKQMPTEKSDLTFYLNRHWNGDPGHVRFQWLVKPLSFVVKALESRDLHLESVSIRSITSDLLLLFTKERKVPLTCRFLSMHQLVSKSSSSSPKGLISCSATCS